MNTSLEFICSEILQCDYFIVAFGLQSVTGSALRCYFCPVFNIGKCTPTIIQCDDVNNVCASGQVRRCMSLFAILQHSSKTLNVTISVVHCLENIRDSGYHSRFNYCM